jgi:hypothetical protein
MMLISTQRRVFLALSLLQCQSWPNSFLSAVTRENMAYIVNRAYKLALNLAAVLSRQHSILQATSLLRTVYTRTKSATTTHVKQ